MNIIEHPEGVKIAACFIGGIIVVSVPSRLIRHLKTLSNTARRRSRNWRTITSRNNQ